MAVPANGVYLFCFTDPRAVPDDPTLSALVVQGVAAAFTRVPLEEWSGPTGEANLQSSEWVVPRALRHEQVIEQVLRAGAVLPVRFGAVFSSEAALAAFLEDRFEQIRQFLSEIVGFEEWSLKSFLDPERAGDWLCTQDRALAERRRRLPTSPGARYLLEKRLTADIDTQARQWARGVAADCHGQLRAMARSARPLRLPAPPESNWVPLAHEALLLPTAAVPGWLTEVQRLHADHAGQGLILIGTGPWPPYSFCPELGKGPT